MKEKEIKGVPLGDDSSENASGGIRTQNTRAGMKCA